VTGGMKQLYLGGLPFANGIVGLGGEIAWPRPTRPGDILHVESEIVEITPSRSKPHQGIVTVRGTMFNQKGGSSLPAYGQAFGTEARPK
jgi:acyl dehydratase